MSDLRDLLLRLLRAPAPSSYETPAAEVWRHAASEFAEVRSDALGNSYATVNAGGRPRVAIVGHIDEIGLIVRHIDETGMLWFGPIGGWDPTVLVGQHVTVVGREGPLPGVIGRKAWHLIPADHRGEAIKLEDLWIDIGARDAADAARLVRIGDPAVLATPPADLANGRMASRAMDNRLGALVALEAARLVAAGGSCVAEVVAVAAVQEETTYAGGHTAAFSLDPDVAIVIDATHASDYPDPSGDLQRKVGARGLGSGPTITRGGSVHGLVAEHLISLAEEHGIGHTLEAEGGDTLTDTDAVHIAREGIPCGLVSVPVRYMHSPSETVELADVSATAELVAHFCRSLAPDKEWNK